MKINENPLNYLEFSALGPPVPTAAAPFKSIVFYRSNHGASGRGVVVVVVVVVVRALPLVVGFQWIAMDFKRSWSISDC